MEKLIKRRRETHEQHRESTLRAQARQEFSAKDDCWLSWRHQLGYKLGGDTLYLGHSHFGESSKKSNKWASRHLANWRFSEMDLSDTP